MSYTVVRTADVEPAFGVFRKMRIALGVAGFGINQIELPPGASGREHDEGASGQEEVYVVLAGSTRLPTAGPDGMTFIAAGGPPGRIYAPSPNL